MIFPKLAGTFQVKLQKNCDNVTHLKYYKVFTVDREEYTMQADDSKSMV
jgi:hypothetical protein